MSYQVIARKWRPQTFEEVTGQEHITRTLKNAIEYERLHHAYLFSGARGVGKTTTARLLAKALNCHKSDKPTINPCRFGDATACASCKEIAEGNSLDTIEFDAASNTGVDKIRDLILENIDIAPARDRYKIFVIDEVHMLSISSFNALLKTLEEPPPRVVFIMATTELHKVPGTILSRCQQFEFRTIALGKIAERLKIIADAEKINVTAEALREIARAGEGSMRDAQSAFDQVINFSGEQIDVSDVTNALGIAESDLLNRVVAAIATQNPAEALKVVSELVSRGQDLRSFCRDLLEHLRDLLVAKIASADADALLDLALMPAKDLQKQANDFSESDLTRFFHSLSETETKMREALQPRYVLEVGLVKLTEMRRLVAFEKILERLSNLESALANKESAAPNAVASVEEPKTNANLQIAAAPRRAELTTKEIEIADGADVRDSLRQIFERRNQMWLSISLGKADFVRIFRNQLKIQFPASHKTNQTTWEKAENIKILQEVCRQTFKRELEICVEIGGETQTNALSPEEIARQREKEELWLIAEADPNVQAALKVFRGKIIDVRRDETGI
jgi:DNA polymerase-3 subunit gamma/tau